MELYRSLRISESGIGQVFGRLTVIGPWFSLPSRTKGRLRHVVCRCECGGHVAVRKQDLANSQQRSCGCLASEITAKRNRDRQKHGHSHTETRKASPEYTAWWGAIQRCETKGHRSYQHYGARGIRMCERWRRSFEAFLDDMGYRPSPDHSIDRIDVNGDYEPGNVRWATSTEQERNKRSSRFVTAMGDTKTVVEWSEVTGIPAPTIYRRLNKGLSPEEAIAMPVDIRKSHKKASA